MDFDLNAPLVLGNITFKNRVFLAPMSGVTDYPFRSLVWKAGAGLVISEMIASNELSRGRAESYMRLQGKGLDIHMVQLSGRDPYLLREAALIAQDSQVDIIDINMGCPAKKVVGGLSGAALMRDLPLALKLIDCVVKNVKIPVTLKMRLGWDDNHINAPELARAAQDLGVKMITVHARTREQFYKGVANWEIVKKVREVLHIPLVINGDITNRKDAIKALLLSGADAVMIGRASYGMPWLLGEILGKHPAMPKNLANYIISHYQDMLLYYGKKRGLRHARKHLGWYIKKHAPHIAKEEYAILMQEENPEKVQHSLQKIFSSYI